MTTKRNIVTYFIVLSTTLLLTAFGPAARAAFGVTFSTALDSSTTIPGGTGNFTGFPNGPGMSSNGAISFFGSGSSGN